MSTDPLEQAQREGLIEPAYNELGVRIGWTLTRRGRRQERRHHSRIAVLGWVLCGLVLVVVLFALAEFGDVLGLQYAAHIPLKVSGL
jgi:hypothetical protein